jgi:hypothetical protein
MKPPTPTSIHIYRRSRLLPQGEEETSHRLQQGKHKSATNKEISAVKSLKKRKKNKDKNESHTDLTTSEGIYSINLAENRILTRIPTEQP